MSSTNLTSHPKKPAILWGTAIYFIILHLAAIGLPIWYIHYSGFVWTDLVSTVVMFVLTCMAITAGYHRMFSHRAYDAHPVIKFLCLLFGAAALEESCLRWSRNHRDHHKYVDTDKDPYNIKKGFWWAHLGWMYHADEMDGRGYSNVEDLKKDRIVMWEHNNYLLMAGVGGFLVPFLIGACFGRPFGGLVWGTVVRQVLTYHNTWFINSAAHYFGTRPYTVQNTARQSWLFGVTSFGEGYHNYHHLFAGDYRCGIRWFHLDSTKWAIYFWSKLGLAWNLQRAPETAIRDAIIQRRYDEAKLLLQKTESHSSRWETWKPQLDGARARLQEISVGWADIKKRYHQWRKNERKFQSIEDQRLAREQLRAQLKTYRAEWLRTWNQYLSMIRTLRRELTQSA